jgi:hypothetical protein
LASITLEFEYTFEDYLEASRTHDRRRRFKDILWYVTASMVLFGVGFTVVNTFWQDPKPLELNQVGGLLIGGAVLFLSSPFFFRLIVRNRWKMQPLLHRKISYEIDPDLVRVATETSTGEMKWANFTRFVESKNVFLLYPNKLTFHIIPKRAFACANDMESFRELATSKIPPSKAEVSTLAIVRWIPLFGRRSSEVVSSAVHTEKPTAIYRATNSSVSSILTGIPSMLTGSGGKGTAAWLT